ncbi:MAG: hypothetical protein ACHQ52_03485 [Candidatus Eisenbacteria bacterium]
MPRRLHGLAVGLSVLPLLLLAWPAAADITVIGHYRLANGDTLTRASYYTNRRMRTTTPNGYEIVYDKPGDRIALIDHARKRYWEGPRPQADSIADAMRKERNQALIQSATPEMKEEWSKVVAALSESVHMQASGRDTMIAGYPCSQWVLTAEPYIRHERWIARSIVVPDFGPEVEKVLLATIMDPVGRALTKVVLQGRVVDGLPLGGRLRFKTPSQEGEFSWVAVAVRGGTLPATTWVVPAGYQLWHPAKATAE